MLLKMYNGSGGSTCNYMSTEELEMIIKLEYDSNELGDANGSQ